MILGIDIGGSAIKAALVDTDTGLLGSDRYLLTTPQGAMPADILQVFREVLQHFDWPGPIGCGLPAAVPKGVVQTAANIDKSWLQLHAGKLFSEAAGRPVVVLNDADAAGIAEMAFGQGKLQTGTVLVVTVGTGLGTALFRNDVLVANTELGHVILNGQDAEAYASAALKTRQQLSLAEWTPRLDVYLHRLEELIWPDLFIIGGGISAQFDQMKPYLTVRTETRPALFGNDAGIVGAAMAAAENRD